MSRFWSDIVGTLTPYVPGEQAAMPGLIKLNTNENPYSPSPRVAVAIAQAAESLQLYPDPGSRVLCQAIAETHGLDAGQVFVGNGSDEVLAHVFKALLKHDAPLLFPDVTYSFYPTYCRLFGIDFREVRLDDSLAVRIADYRQPCGAIILPNPNAPTGMLLPLRDIESLLQDHPDQMVVVDEAYGDFGGESAVSLVARYDNLLVVQTFSKSRSLAGLRVGFAMGQRPLIEALERVRDSFNSYPLDRLAQAGALAAWTDRDWFETHRRLVIDEREGLADALRALRFDVLPSAANFLLAAHPAQPAAHLLSALRRRNILVRHFKHPRIENHLRITVGTDRQCDALVAALRQILAGS